MQRRGKAISSKVILHEWNDLAKEADRKDCFHLRRADAYGNVACINNMPQGLINTV